MGLSNDLISQFVKVTQDKEQVKKETTAYGKIVKQGDVDYVQLDGSDLLTPISTTAVVKDGDRVIVTIKNHTAIVTGDLTNPSANNTDVSEISNKISEFDIVVADKVTTQDLEAINAYLENIVAISGKYEELSAITAEIETLQAKYASMDYITAKDAEIINAEIESLKSEFGEFTQISAEDLEAINADFDNLVAYNATFTYVSAEVLNAMQADIKELYTKKLDAETANIKYASIDFSNIGVAAIEKLFTDSGIIKDLIMSDGKVTGELVGVTIKGDLIEGNTVKADKLVILGEDGIYYKLNVDALGETTASSDEKYQNGLDGSVIIAKSLTAEKVAVDDLVAFGATIGGYHIDTHSLYSGAKASVDNTTDGVFLGDDGQMSIGNANNFLKFFIDENGEYKLEIQANVIRFGANGTTVEEAVNEANIGIIDDFIGIAGNEFVKNENFEAYRKTVSTQFAQTNEDFNFLFNNVNSQVDILSNETNAQFQEIQKYIRFVDGNIVLGEAGNELTLKIQNNRISFLQSGIEVAYFSNNKLYVTDGEFMNSLQIGNFAFIPRSNGNLSFKKVGGN